MRIGVFGGSFDPIHIGHLAVAAAATEQLELALVHFMPAGQQPFKLTGHAAGPEDRAVMVGLAIRDEPRFVLDRRELDRKGPSYTIDSLRELRDEFPSDELCFLVGADAVHDLPAWKEATRLVDLATIVAFARPGASLPESDLVSRTIQVPAVDVSATQVRDLAMAGRSIRGLVPELVAEYIEQHSLYRT